MLFPIFLFLMVLSPLFIPIAVTLVDQVANLRSWSLDRPVGSLRQFRPAVALVPAAA
ncbi:MAG: hypothetical protein QOF31_4438 [Mycobacterium sp.]|jgi:hypothetical protein|nr:hypothetical protein [Mycobacterium sp.]